MRQFHNTNGISKSVLLLRLRKLDVFADAYLYPLSHRDAGEQIANHTHYVVESFLSDSAIEVIFSTSETAEEQAIVANYLNAASGFESLPNWSTWTQAEFDTWCNNNLMTDAQIDAATLSAALKTNLKANNAFTRNGGKSILFLRDYLIKTRR